MPIIKILPHPEYCPNGAEVHVPAGTSICEAMLEPTRPAKTKAEMVGLNSNMVESRVILPTTVFGIKSLTNWKAVCIVATAPIKTDMMATIPSEPIPTDTISRITSSQ